MTATSGGLSTFNRALGLIPRRAERQQSAQLRETFVDSGVAGALESIDHQIFYGRRGTGKTHALRYLESTMQGRGDAAVYVDLRQVGSPEGLFNGESTPTTERAARLLIDVINSIHDELLAAALQDDSLVADVAFTDALYQLEEAVSTVVVVGNVEKVAESEHAGSSQTQAGAGLKVSPNVIALQGSASKQKATRERVLERQTSSGQQRIHLNFSDIFAALKAISSSLSGQRVWLLLDEWGSIPRDVQPMLAEFLVRCVLPLDRFTVKISAIEQESVFRAVLDGRMIGIEVGADVAADVNLDEFMVYEQNEDQSREFFRGLLHKHLSAAAAELPGDLELRSAADVISTGFTDRRAFDELVRAAEGVPRDAINIAAKAGLRAKSKRISIPDIRAAARQWYQTDKEQAVRSRSDANELLVYIIDEVIRQRRTRGFLVNQRWASSELLATLFEARVLHLVRRGYSAQDEPGERYDVWVIDYGAYVDLMNTKNEPKLLLRDDEDSDGSDVEVPIQDLRAIRRSILDLSRFE